MPTWILGAGTFLKSHRWLVGGIAAALLLAFLVWRIVAGVNDMLEHARADGRAEVQAKWNAEKAGRAEAARELSAAVVEAIHGIDASLQGTMLKINDRGQEINVRLTKEMAGDPRYASADCSLTPGVLDQVNAARGLSGSPPASVVHDGGVPTSGAAVRLDLGAPR